MVNTGWRYESHRHALAAKGVKTNHVYHVRKYGPVGRPTGQPRYDPAPQPKSPVSLERQALSKSIYEVFKDDPENLQKARQLQGEIIEIERQRAMIPKDFTRGQSDVALYGRAGLKYPTVGEWADDLLRKTPKDRRAEVEKLLRARGLLDNETVWSTYLAGQNRETINVKGLLEEKAELESLPVLSPGQKQRRAYVDLELDLLRNLNDPQDPDAGMSDDLSRYSELTAMKSVKEKELVRLLGFQSMGSIMGTGARVSPTDIRRAESVRENLKENTPAAREQLPLSDIVVPKTRSGELMVPSSPLREKAVAEVVAKQESRAARLSKQSPEMLGGVKPNATMLNLGSDIPGSMGRSVRIKKNPAKKDDDDREYMSGRALFGAGVGQ